MEGAVDFGAAAPSRGIGLSITRDGASVVTEPAPAPGDAEHDPRLVGTWTRNDTIRSGDAILVTQLVLIVNPDGTFVRRVGKTVGGGAGWGVSDGASEGTCRYWKTEGNLHPAGTGRAWQPYAPYQLKPGEV